MECDMTIFIYFLAGIGGFTVLFLALIGALTLWKYLT